MKDRTVLQERYLRETLPNQLGELAAKLARISSFSQNELSCDAVASLIEESKFFIEWTAMDAGIDRAAELVELQVQLAQWQLGWQDIWVDRARKLQVASQAKAWAKLVLEISQEEQKRFDLAKKIKNKLSKTFSGIESIIYIYSQTVEIILVDLNPDSSKFSQEIISDAAKIIAKIIPKNNTIKIYSQTVGNDKNLEFSLEEEIEKYCETQLKNLMLGKINIRYKTRFRAINITQADKLAVELGRKLGSEELNRKQLYAEHEIIGYEALQKYIAIGTILFFGLFSPFRDVFDKKPSSNVSDMMYLCQIETLAIPKATPRNNSSISGVSNKSEIRCKSVIEKNSKTNDENNKLLISGISGILVFFSLIAWEIILCVYIAKKKDQLLLMKYALEKIKTNKSS